jgi:hypothetical protein
MHVPGPHEKALPSFYPFRSDVEYAQVMWWTTYRISRRAINDWFSDPRMDPIRVNHFYCQSARDVIEKLALRPAQLDIKPLPWTTRTIEILINNYEVRKLTIYYRNAMDVVSFLLGHRPHRDDLVYAPVRQFGSNGQRIYDELHTAEWWWERQHVLRDGATVVPIMVASDKTHLSNHAGSKKLWPVYMTIGNLKLRARRAASRSAFVLLGYVPVDPPGDNFQRIRLFHKALSVMLKRMCPLPTPF